MLHLTRIMLAPAALMILVGQPMYGESLAMTEKHSDYQTRCETLAKQLEDLNRPQPREALAASRVPEGSEPISAETVVLQQKAAWVSSSLASLIAEQRGQASIPAGAMASSDFDATSAPQLHLGRYIDAPERKTPFVLGALEDEAAPSDREAFNKAEWSRQGEGGAAPAENAENPSNEPAAGAEENADAAVETNEGEETPTALPPAPRIQTSDEVKESNASLVSQLRGLMKMVSVGGEVTVSGTPDNTPMLNVTASAAGSAIPQTVEPDDELDGMPAVQEASAAETTTAPESLLQPAAAPVAAARQIAYEGNPLDQLVDIDCRDMDLTHVVAVLALKADINIIAGADLRGTVTANLRQVPLRVAMETALRMNGLGMIEENGIYFIIPYEESAAVNRKTTMVTLNNAEAGEVKKALEESIKGIRDEAVVNISANKSANVLLISAPENRVDELVAMAMQLDVAEPVLPTITEAISLNYTDPADMLKIIDKMLTEKIGKASADERARHVVVTDMPVVVEQIKELVKKVDIPTKQVLIESMVVDAVLGDEADTGVQWLMESVRRMSRREAALGEDGRAVGNLQELSLLSNLEALQNPGSALNFGLLANNINWQGLIQMEIRNRNGRLVSNPVLLTVENEPAKISIAQEIPYIELKSSEVGGQQTTTRFKEVGTVLTVTPRVTHDDTIICTVAGKESNTAGEFQGIPIEDKREIESTMRMASGQTIYIGGLRKSNATSSVKKIPVLGDVPMVNFMFRSNQRRETINELLVFITCSVVNQEANKLTPAQQEIVDKAPPVVPRVDAWETIMYDTKHPQENKNIQRNWRRGS